MLQNVDHMEASGVFCVKAGRFDQYEQRNISVLHVTSLGIVIRTGHYELRVRV